MICRLTYLCAFRFYFLFIYVTHRVLLLSAPGFGTFWFWYFWMTFASNSARFLWKSIPSAIKENHPEVVAAWKIGQRLWMRDYTGVHEAIRGFDWSQQAQSLVSSFSGMFSHLHWTRFHLFLLLCKSGHMFLDYSSNCYFVWNFLKLLKSKSGICSVMLWFLLDYGIKEFTWALHLM